MARAQAGYHLAALHFAARYRPDGRTFVEHLVRTAAHSARGRRARAGRPRGAGPGATARAKLGGGPRGRSTANRRKLTAAVGEEAEAVVAAYSVVPLVGTVDPGDDRAP